MEVSQERLDYGVSQDEFPTLLITHLPELKPVMPYSNLGKEVSYKGLHYADACDEASAQHIAGCLNLQWVMYTERT
jgi:hypothetical protein